MAKQKKQTVHMIDMSNRLNVKIIHEEYTSEDLLEWENEPKEMNQKMKERARKYHEYFQLLIDAAISDTSIPEKDADYFINKYADKFSGRNQDNVKSRIEFYNKCLEEQD